MKLSVIIPVYNEAATIDAIIDRVRNCGVPDLDIIVVDDCSGDGTRERLRQLPQSDDLRIFYHEKNRGKGAAIRTAQQHVTGDVVVIQDADLEYDPREFPRMLRPIEQGIADACFGSRYSGNEILADTFWHYFGNKMLTTFFNIFANIHLTDMETCYKMVRADIFRDLRLECNRFGIEPELAAKLVKRGCRIYEIPISYHARRYQAGKKIGWKDGLAALWFILRYTILYRPTSTSSRVTKVRIQ